MGLMDKISKSFFLFLSVMFMTSRVTTATYHDTRCVGDMLELSCSIRYVIVVRDIRFGTSRTCRPGPWPAGCEINDPHFHPCTGLRLCTVNAPKVEIKSCGFNDYARIEYDCAKGECIAATSCCLYKNNYRCYTAKIY